MTPVTRREFVRVTAVAGGGFQLAIALPARFWESPGSPAADADLTAFIHIGADDIVTITVPRPDMGQGSRTALAMLIAEELDADWSLVRVEQADLDEKRYGSQYAGGSNSVRAGWMPLRRAGATARWMLVEAAAGRWEVEASACVTEPGLVRHPASGRSSGYGALAADAARLPVPDDPPLKDPVSYRLIGHSTRQLDAPDIVVGSAVFGLDVERPRMLRAVVERAPVFGGRLAAVDRSAALAVPGVRHVVEIPGSAFRRLPNEPLVADGVAVLADSTWAALQGRRALRVEWDPGPGSAESTESFWERCEEAASRPDPTIVRDDGDIAAALESASRTIRSVYRLPFLAHAQMEPLNCVAEVTEGGCEIWAPTQNPAGTRHVAAAILKRAPETIQVHVMRSGGGFGRRFYGDYAAEAVFLSDAVGAPVQVTWTREDDMRHGAYRPAGYYTLEGGLDDQGNIVAWHDHLVNASRARALGMRPTERQAGQMYEYEFPMGFIPNVRLEYTEIDSVVQRGQWRAIEDSSNIFILESFFDELVRAAGRDPLEARLSLLGEPRQIPYWGGTYDTGRLRGVLETAASAAGWGQPLPNGVGRGLAASYANGAYVAHVVDVALDDGGKARVLRVVSAVDCGRVVNPSGAAAQVEGSIVFGLTAALYGRITVAGGSVNESNYHDYPVMRIDEMPEVDVHFIDSQAPPSGIGEGALPPMAPALTNAVYDLTGFRARTLPLAGQDLTGRG